jgi:TnpA family transposase
MIPGVQVSQIASAMRAMESQGRLAKANERILDFQQSMDISKLWGDGDKGSADSMTMDTSRHLHVARMEYRRKQPGIGIYTHVRDSYGLFYNQPIVLNDRQAASAVHGVESHNATRREDQIKLSLLAVDTHGYTNAAMSIAKFLQFDLCVRLRQISERMLYPPPSIKLPESLERLRTGKVSPKKVKVGWDTFLRFVA